MKILISFFLLISCSLIADISEPYCSIKELPFDPQGWFGNSSQIDELLKKNPSTVIEVGSSIGVSTRYIAKKMSEGSKVYSIGMWQGTAGQQDPRLPYLFQLFLSNIKRDKLTEVVVPIRMKSLEAAKALDLKADIIYIDNARDSQSVYDDIMAWYPHLKEEGVICGDDWSIPTVRLGVTTAAQILNVSIISQGNFWMYD